MICCEVDVHKPILVATIIKTPKDSLQPQMSKGCKGNKNESAGKKKSVRVSRAGVYLKPALVQVAHAAVKDKQNPYYAIKYERIAKRRGKKRAIIAIARIILTAIFAMLSTGATWDPVVLFKVDMPQHLKE